MAVIQLVGADGTTATLPLPSNWGSDSTDLEMAIEMITKDAERSSNGVLTAGLTVNIGVTLPVHYARLSPSDMKTLCIFAGYNVPNKEDGLTSLTIAQRTYAMTTILPCGVRTTNVYFSDSLKCSLHFTKPIDEEFNLKDGVWEEYCEWRDVSFDLVFIGASTTEA
jgi:hypothetical protein